MEEIVDITEIQQIALNILIYVDKVCDENNLRYALAGGTFLGAIRHKGFIPWDDDIDIVMPRDDYEKFLDIMDKADNKRYKALHFGKSFPNYFYPFCKVCDTDTKLFEGNYINNNQLGVFIDIFPVDGIPNKHEKILKKVARVRANLNFACEKKYTKSKKGFIRSFLKLGKYCLVKLFGWKYWYKKFDKISKKHNFNDYELSIPYSGCYGKKDILPKNYFNDLIKIKFENYYFLSFKEYDKYLSKMYGDYMTPPPKEKQITHHDFKIYKK